MSRRQRRGRKKRRQSATRPTSHALATGAGISLAAAFGAPATAQATDFTVTDTADPLVVVDGACVPGDCSLREAVQATWANATVKDRILFQAGLTGTIQLLPGHAYDNNDLYFEGTVDVLGPGAKTLTVSPATGYQVFYTDTDPGQTVTISGLTLSGGDDNSGGAIRKTSGDLRVVDSTISGNTAANRGGGIVTYNGTTTIEDSTITGNDAGNHGGGIWASNDELTIENSTISGNGSNSRGGGVYAYQGTTEIKGSTISGNDADRGGGVYSKEGTLTIENSTISGNEVTGAGGGVHSYASPAADPTLVNTIVAGNTAAVSGPDLSPGAGLDEFDAAFSLIGSSAGATVNATVAGSNIIGQNAQLGPLADNGGPTRTMLPSLASPAIDRGSALGPDQRGLARPVDLPGITNSGAAGANRADIGSVERQLASNAFTFGALKRHPRKGTATLAVKVPGAGSVVLSGGKVKGASKNSGDAGIVKLLIRAKGGAAERLRGTGRSRVRAKVTFTPSAGYPRSRARVVRLVKR